MRTLGRRLFSKAAVGAPTALALKMPGPTLSSGGVPMPTLNAAGPNPSWGDAAALSDKIYRALWKRQRADAPAEARRHVRRHLMGGLDPDLSVLNSMSLQHRIGRQIEREEKERERSQGIRAAIIKALGGKVEDFE